MSGLTNVSEIHDGLARGKAMVAGLAAVLVGEELEFATLSVDLASTPSTLRYRIPKWSEIQYC